MDQHAARGGGAERCPGARRGFLGGAAAGGRGGGIEEGPDGLYSGHGGPPQSRRGGADGGDRDRVHEQGGVGEGGAYTDVVLPLCDWEGGRDYRRGVDHR